MRHVLILLCLLLFCSITRGQEESGTPSFGAGISLPESLSAISPLGNFAVDIGYKANGSQGAKSETATYLLSVWDLRDDGRPHINTPTSEFTLNYTPHPTIGAAINIAISSDERYFAVRVDDGVVVLTLPELEVVRRIPSVITESTFFDEIKWSPDNRYLAFDSDGGTITVWDRHTNILFKERSAIRGPLTPIEDGWLVRFPLSFDFRDVFIFCTMQLDECTTYSLDDLPIDVEQHTHVSIAHNGQVIVTRLELPNGDEVDWLWRRQPDGFWLVDASPLSVTGRISNLQKPLFSSDGRYLMVVTCQLEGGDDCDQYVWDVENNTEAHVFETLCSGFYFFPNNSNFILCDRSLTLSIYQIGQFNALDEVTLSKAYEFPHQIDFSEIRLSILGNRIIIPLTSYDYGDVTITIPIIYQAE